MRASLPQTSRATGSLSGATVLQKEWVSRMPITLVAVLFLCTPTAFAANYSGPVLDVRMQNSPSTPGNTRVGILTSATTACATNNWFAYEFADAGVGKTWTAALLAALASGRSVFIGGTGGCDSYGVETIYYIDAL
jgi:hypothetical protein